MSRKQRIIVSITGIVLVSLILIGLTYGYFLTKINGNTNTKSISVTTAKLELVYGDNSAEIIRGTGVLMPSTDLTSAGAIGTKTFTVTNNGNDSSYVVIIDNVSVTKASDGSSTTFVSNDFRYTLSCTKSDGTKCNEVNDLTIFPIKGGILLSNDIVEDDVHTYTLTLWYIDTGLNQSDDMGKSLQARVNIADVNQMENPFKTGVTATDNASLAYNIIKNAKDNKNGTSFLNTSKSTIAESISQYGTGEFTYETVSTSNLCSGTAPWLVGDTPSAAQSGSSVSSYEEAVGKYVYDQCDAWTKYLDSYDSSTSTLSFKSETMADESTLSMTNDNYGTSYYFRGNVEDNYVTFADMCWRIVRINGDGSTKLILEDQDQPCSEDINGNWDIPTTTGGTTKTGNFGYTQYAKETLTASDGTTKNASTRYLMDYLHGQTSTDRSMATAFKNFQSTFTETELSKLKSGNWCLNDTAYDSSNNLLNSTQIMDNKIKGTSFNYDSLVRLYNNSPKQPTLKCKGTIMNDWDDDETNPTPMYVGTLTADEIVYAGGKVYTSNQNYYLINNYQKSNSKFFWSLSPCTFNGSGDYAFLVYRDGNLGNRNVDVNDVSFRPSVSLASSAVISSGEGTLEKPYVIG